MNTYFVTNKNLILHVCLGFLLIIVLQKSCLAEVSDHTTSTQLTLATGEHYSPYIDKTFPNGGWSLSIVKEVLNKLSVEYELIFLPWGRVLKWTREGNVFGGFPFVYSPQRAETLLFSDPINYVPVHMYVAEHSSFTSLESLRTKRLCFPYDYALSSLEKDIVNKYQMTINRVKDGEGCIKHVQKGWSDAGLINSYVDVSKLPVVQLEGKHIKVFTQQLALVPLYFVISKESENSQLWIDKFNQGLALITSNGQRNNIDKQYLKLLQH